MTPLNHQLLLPPLNSYFRPLSVPQNSHLKSGVCCMGEGNYIVWIQSQMALLGVRIPTSVIGVFVVLCCVVSCRVVLFYNHKGSTQIKADSYFLS